MSKGQKRVLAIMALVMVLVISAVVLLAVSNNLNRSNAEFQYQLDTMATQVSR